MAPLLRAYQFVLEYGSEELSAGLGAQVKYSKFESCLAVSYNRKCNELTLVSDQVTRRTPSGRPLLGQVLQIDDFTDNNYLVFVSKIPATQEEKQVLEGMRAGVKYTPQDLKSRVHNEPFWRTGLRIKLYAPDRPLHLATYQVPYYVDSQFTVFDPQLTWLAVCVNGRLKAPSASQRPVNKFWQKIDASAEAAQYWQETGNADMLQPTADICDRYYEQVPFA